MRNGHAGVSWGLLTALVLALVLCGCEQTEACQEGLPERGLVLDWLRQRILDGLGLDEAPDSADSRGPYQRGPFDGRLRGRRAVRAEARHAHQDASQIILFPSSDSTCAPPTQGATNHFTYYFQPSAHSLESTITSGHFWFYSGAEPRASNASAPLFVLTAGQRLVQAAEAPERREGDGWAAYRLEHGVLASLSDGPFAVQVRCLGCACPAGSPDTTPFLHLRARARGPDRSRRSSIPWSLSALDRLQRPAQDGGGDGGYDDCHHKELNISFQELGWENWIVHPKVFTFHYCHGNCSSQDRITTLMGIRQCCAPVPGSMKPLRVRTTSDGGYSVKYETLPNIIAEECACI